MGLVRLAKMVVPTVGKHKNMMFVYPTQLSRKEYPEELVSKIM